MMRAARSVPGDWLAWSWSAYTQAGHWREQVSPEVWPPFLEVGEIRQSGLA